MSSLELEERVNEFRPAETALPGLNVPLWCLGDIHRETGELEESERYYRKAVAAEPSDAAALARLGRLLIEKGNRAEGSEVYRAGARRGRRVQDGPEVEATL